MSGGLLDDAGDVGSVTVTPIQHERVASASLVRVHLVMSPRRHRKLRCDRGHVFAGEFGQSLAL
jgi:hypothetical protein